MRERMEIDVYVDTKTERIFFNDFFWDISKRIFCIHGVNNDWPCKNCKEYFEGKIIVPVKKLTTNIPIDPALLIEEKKDYDEIINGKKTVVITEEFLIEGLNDPDQKKEKRELPFWYQEILKERENKA